MNFVVRKGSHLETDLRKEVREANQNFYRAFESLKIEEMKAIWLNDERTTCIHPGWEPIFGWDLVMESWETIFHNTKYMEFEIEEKSIIVSEDLAVVSCTENLVSANGEQVSNGRVLATNVFVKRDGKWCVLSHHAS